MIGFDLNLREKFIENLCQKYPFVKCETIGKSLCNRDIRGLKIGSEKNAVLFAAAFHGMEWLTSLLVLKFAESLCTAICDNLTINGINIQDFLTQKGLVVVPCVNPDGVEISLNGAKTAGMYESLVNKIAPKSCTDSWQANARGVDLNHNFDANWRELHSLEAKRGIIAPAHTRYGGTKPESEPETQAIVRLCEKFNFRHVLAFHSQGEEIYWNFGNETPKKSLYMGKTMAKLSGYKLSEPEGLAVGGGFKDWFIEKIERPGFTIEIGKGKNPLPLDDINQVYQKLHDMLIYCALA